MYRTATDTELNALSKEIIGSCIEVHKALGPGLLESIYAKCLARDLDLKHIKYNRESCLMIDYKGACFQSKLKADFIVEDLIIIELKAVETMNPIYISQIMTYLKLTNIELGLLINFNVAYLKDGIQRIRLNYGSAIRDAQSSQT
ncbi:MAG: GxxExxY protein [Actinomycetota bacterium]|nr:GxxExxY protein [Actinomycetota bacterium]